MKSQILEWNILLRFGITPKMFFYASVNIYTQNWLICMYVFHNSSLKGEEQFFPQKYNFRHKIRLPMITKSWRKAAGSLKKSFFYISIQFNLKNRNHRNALFHFTLMCCCCCCYRRIVNMVFIFSKNIKSSDLISYLVSIKKSCY